MDVYIRARPVARSEARFPPLHQEPGTGARSCPRGPGFLVARAIELAQAYVLDAGRPTASRTTQRTARRRPGPARSQRRTRPRPASLPAALRGRDGLVCGLVDAEDLRQSGDLQDFRIPCCVQTRSSEPSWARPRLRPPTAQRHKHAASDDNRPRVTGHPRRVASRQVADRHPRPATPSEASQPRACKCLRSEWHRTGAPSVAARAGPGSGRPRRSIPVTPAWSSGWPPMDTRSSAGRGMVRLLPGRRELTVRSCRRPDPGAGVLEALRGEITRRAPRSCR
jgi:hypothetical protein